MESTVRESDATEKETWRVLSARTVREIVESFPYPLFVVDEDVRILECNEAAQKLVGAGSGYLLRRKGGEVLGCINALGGGKGCGSSPACAGCVIRGSVGEAMANRKVSRAKARLELVDGNGKSSERFMLVTASPLETPGHDRAVLLMLEDITEVVRLKSLLSMCAGCKKIRDDENYWRDVESYLQQHLDVEFSHGLCPECVERLYPEYASKLR